MVSQAPLWLSTGLIRYAIPVWGGLVTSEMRGPWDNQCCFHRAFKYSFCKNLLTVEQIKEAADYRFF